MAENTQEREDQDIDFANDMFNFDRDDLAIEEEDDIRDLTDFDGVDTLQEEEDSEQDTDEEEEEEEEDLDSIFEEKKEEEEEEDDEEFTDEDLASLNKKLNKNFQTTQELKDFLSKGEEKKETNTEDEDYQKAVNTLSWYEPIMKLNDEDLLREDFKARYSRSGKDLNDQDVQDEIEDKIEEMIDARTLSLHAANLRKDIQSQVIDKFEKQKQEIEKAREERKAAQELSEKEEIKNALADIYNKENFYGVKPDKKTIAKVYESVRSGDFLKTLQSDKKAVAELAMMMEYKETIYKKSSGLNYNDGMAAVLNDFKAKKDRTGNAPIVGAQKRGSVGSSDKSQGLLASLLK